MVSVCPRCGSERLRVSRGHSLSGRIAYWLGLSAVYCKNCGHRLRESDNWWDNIRWARCPQCYRRELVDWEEKYLYPRGWRSFLVYAGARPHRCRACRINFVSLLPRYPDSSRVSGDEVPFVVSGRGGAKE